MPSRGRVRLSLVIEMLENCAPGYVLKPGKHNLRLFYNGKFAALPSGEHGAGDRAEIQIGKVRNAIRALGIGEDCAARFIERLKG